MTRRTPKQVLEPLVAAQARALADETGRSITAEQDQQIERLKRILRDKTKRLQDIYGQIALREGINLRRIPSEYLPREVRELFAEDPADVTEERLRGAANALAAKWASPEEPHNAREVESALLVLKAWRLEDEIRGSRRNSLKWKGSRWPDCSQRPWNVSGPRPARSP